MALSQSYCFHYQAKENEQQQQNQPLHKINDTAPFKINNPFCNRQLIIQIALHIFLQTQARSAIAFLMLLGVWAQQAANLMSTIHKTKFN